MTNTKYKSVVTYDYKNLYRMKVVEREKEFGFIFKNVTVRKITDLNFTSEILANCEYNNNDNTPLVRFRIQTSTHDLFDNDCDLYIKNLIECKQAIEYFKGILKEVCKYNVTE
ncbi:hypothetical protein [Mammaliicoccus sciuri]|uniref:hypothetical protein n=1 Tax=Mammaliicoccus sciuri TaxID=1296 RepID=UPI0021D2851C|nr:hypothetical protein [Mammaliicoccus sciuri]UXU70122.1 hypothetical protein MUA36_05435 [Mammaliicoccus sciuri]